MRLIPVGVICICCQCSGKHPSHPTQTMRDNRILLYPAPRNLEGLIGGVTWNTSSGFGLIMSYATEVLVKWLHWLGEKTWLALPKNLLQPFFEVLWKFLYVMRLDAKSIYYSPTVLLSAYFKTRLEKRISILPNRQHTIFRLLSNFKYLQYPPQNEHGSRSLKNFDPSNVASCALWTRK